MYYAGMHGRVDVIMRLLQRMATMSSGDGGGVGVDVRNAAYDGEYKSNERAEWTALHAAAGVCAGGAAVWRGCERRGGAPGANNGDRF